MNDIQVSRSHAFLKAQFEETLLVAESWGIAFRHDLLDSISELDLRDQVPILRRWIDLLNEQITYRVLRRNDELIAIGHKPRVCSLLRKRED